MSIFVTATGFQKKTLPELKTEYEALFQGVFGSNIDLGAEGSFGQIIGILSKRDADIWDGAEEIYNSRDPGQATGTSLDNIAAETGVTRLPATGTIIENVALFGTESTVVAAGKKAKQSTSDLTYSLRTAVTITKAAARHVELEPNISFPASGGETFTVTIDATPYTYVAIAADTKKIVLDALVALIIAGSWAGTPSNENDTTLKLLYATTDFNVLWTATFDLDLLGSGGDFDADETGANTVPINTLTVISTPVTGWDSVNNPVAGTQGRALETDAELRIRRDSAYLTGNATDEAIRSKILQNVSGVTSATVTSNRTNTTDASGRPPKSFEAVVEGGDNDDLASEIWTTMPSGIEPYGNTTVVVADSQGNNQSIKFSRPETMYVWITVKRNFNSEESYPTNGDDTIKANIVAWAAANLDPGIDLIRQRLNTPIYDVPGIGDIEITLDYSISIGHSPVYSEQNVPVTIRQLASVAVSRIIVAILP